MRGPLALGEKPPVGTIPELMQAQVIRENRFGPPLRAFCNEVVPVPEIGPREVLVYVMAAGVNYNNVWAALGQPVNVIDARRRRGDTEPFHIGGSDASGIVWRKGSDVHSVAEGDEVVVHCGRWDVDDPYVKDGGDPALAPSQHIWGYESNFGSFAQFTRVLEHQCLPKPSHLTWEEAAAYMLVGATAYRMLFGWEGNRLRAGEPVLVWGGSGGLGCMAIQLVREFGAEAVAVVSTRERAEYCKELGAVGTINRAEFDHWGLLPDIDDQCYTDWLDSARRFGKAFQAAIGRRRNPAIVLEHPGQDTLPTSLFAVAAGGMVVICAGTTGFNGTLDLRYHWMRQKRLQGSHFANAEQCVAFNRLVDDRRIRPCVSAVFPFESTGKAHQLMYENKHPPGNMVVTVNSR
jgi:crotonyl-CoA carboxylase/reductase